MKPRRSLHFVPGGDERKFRKALDLPADALILDLEDSVSAQHKESARKEVCHWLTDVSNNRHSRAGGNPELELMVRINPLDSEWGRADLEAVLPHGPAAIILPKVESREMVLAADTLITTAEAETGLILIGTETPAAVFQLPSMAEPDRVQGLTWGAEDLSACLGSRRTRDTAGDYLDVFRLVRSMSLLAAAAASVQPIDTVFTDIQDIDGLQAEAQQAADMGFTGKLSIHPSQIEPINAAFTPTPQEVTDAEELIALFAENANQGITAFRYRGQMVDTPHLKRAHRLLAAAPR